MKKLAVALLCALLPCTVMGATAFKPYGLTDAEIGTVRGDKYASWKFEGITALSPVAYNIYGEVLDNSNVFTDLGDWGQQSFGVKVIGIQSAPNVTSGDTVTFTYVTAAGGGELTLKVFFPAVTANTTFWVDTNGMTYSDEALTTKVGSTPTPAPSPTAVPKTPTPAPTPTAVPISPTPTPVTHNVGIVEFEELSANPSAATMETDGSEARFYLKGDQMVLQFNPSSTVTWYYVMDISVGVTDGITWTGQTTAP